MIDDEIEAEQIEEAKRQEDEPLSKNDDGGVNPFRRAKATGSVDSSEMEDIDDNVNVESLPGYLTDVGEGDGIPPNAKRQKVSENLDSGT